VPGSTAVTPLVRPGASTVIVSVPLVDIAFAPNTLHDEQDQ
jgi:hypothetical protein